MQLSVIKAGKAESARTAAEDQVAEASKESIMLNLEIKEIKSQHKMETTRLENEISRLEDENAYALRDQESLRKAKDEMNTKIKKLTEEVGTHKENYNSSMAEIEKMKKSYDDEKMKKIQAVNKLAEIMNRKDMTSRDKRKVESAELRKKDKVIRNLQQELEMERNKFGEKLRIAESAKQEAQVNYDEERKIREKLQMEVDSKDAEIEGFQQKLAAIYEGQSISSGNDDGGGGSPLDDTIASFQNSFQINQPEVRLEGWLSIPNKQNIKRHGWKHQYVVVSTKKIFFYNNEDEKQKGQPNMILDLDKLFHVRSVTQGDVIRADSKEIPRIFQILYATEAESKKPDDQPENRSAAEAFVSHKGHELLQITYRTPTTCEVCPKSLGNILTPPLAYECKRCRIKIHKDHLDKKEDIVAPCRVNSSFHSAKELLLLALSKEDQHSWVQRLSKRITRQGIVKQGPAAGGSSPRPWRLHTPEKSSTHLHPNYGGGGGGPNASSSPINTHQQPGQGSPTNNNNASSTNTITNHGGGLSGLLHLAEATNSSSSSSSSTSSQNSVVSGPWRSRSLHNQKASTLPSRTGPGKPP